MSLKRQVEEIISEKLRDNDDDAFFVLDVENLVRQHLNWIEKIPRVKPFYAVKCNDSEIVLKILATLGAGFDCASKGEIEKVLKLGVPPEKIVLAHTAKQISLIEYAKRVGVLRLTFDCQDELNKIQKHYPEAELVLRIRYDAKTSLISFGRKFGCDPTTEAEELIEACKKLRMNLIGISFHVGSFQNEKEIIQNALRTVRDLFDFASLKGIDMHFVDIGGGFVGNDAKLMEIFSEDINEGVKRFFAGNKYEIIAEPGRYFVSSAFTLVCNVVTKKIRSDSPREKTQFEYFLNDGIFGSFLGKLLGKALNKQVFEPLTSINDTTLYSTTVWGQTLDIIDKLGDQIMLPELETGDWLLIRNMGSYTYSAFVGFNGFEKRKVYPIALNKNFIYSPRT